MHDPARWQDSAAFFNPGLNHSGLGVDQLKPQGPLTDCTQVNIDANRTGAVGASFGGYTIYWLMGHDTAGRFKAMIAHCGVFNLESMYLSTEELFFVNWDLGGPYWRSPEVARDYRRFSPSNSRSAALRACVLCPFLICHRTVWTSWAGGAGRR